jgi:tight adherence protein B
MTKAERVRYVLTGSAGTFLLIYLFYHSILASVVFAGAGGFLYPQYQKKELAKKSRWRLMVEFKDAMDSMVSALVAGYSMENAVSEAYKDLKLMYERDTPMLLELKNLKQKLRLQQPLDKLLLEFGRRSGVEDILTFAQIYATARKSGGNLVKVMKRTADNIGEKMEIQREIQTMIAGKKMESLCMMVIPLFIILYMQFFSPGFLNPVYSGISGRMFMSAMLAAYILSVLWSRSIMNIRC